MSLLLTPGKIGNLELKNRIVRAPVYEALAETDGSVNDALINFYTRLAKGGAGLICTGYMFAAATGRAQIRQVGIHSDEMLPGLKKLADAVHNEGAKIAFEISHAGRQTEKHLIGRNPFAPSGIRRDPSFFIKPDEMTGKDVDEIVEAFIKAAERAVAAGSDLIYLHAGGGDLLNQFLSPFFNVRKDKWGGSAENRFRILHEIITGIKRRVSDEIPMLVKMNSQDLPPKTGITTEIAAGYVTMLNKLGVDALELTTGVKFYNHMLCWRGDVPVKEIVQALPWWKKTVGWVLMKNLQGKHDLVEGWILDDLQKIKHAAGGMKLFIVGGLRKTAHMEEILETGDADFISLARPLIRQPSFPKQVMEGKAKEVTCISCNRCIGGLMNHLPVACYQKGLPHLKE